jgi:ribosomal protein S18 acetylase RimI-like enzyme
MSAARLTATHPLDNPVWESLASRHAAFAVRNGDAARYLPEFAPFAAVSSFGIEAGGQMAMLVSAAQTILFVGPPPRFGAGWQVQTLEHIAQMTRAAPLDVPPGPPILQLEERHLRDVLGLTARVYPHYFREHTFALGRYFGIYEGDKLAAITGERMRFDGHVELSAICTDPAFSGRGYARRLVATLVNDVLARGDLPFLHVSHRNARAKALYEHMGFCWRSDIGLTAARRDAAVAPCS